MKVELSKAEPLLDAPNVVESIVTIEGKAQYRLRAVKNSEGKYASVVRHYGGKGELIGEGSKLVDTPKIALVNAQVMLIRCLHNASDNLSCLELEVS